MVMTSGQISQMIAGQMSMFGAYQSYATQITPPYAMANRPPPAMAPVYQAPPAHMPPPMMGYSGGVFMGPPPPPVPGFPAAGWNPYAMQQAGMPSMGRMGYMAAVSPTMGAEQVLGERLMGTGLNAARAIGSGFSAVNTGAALASLPFMLPGGIGSGLSAAFPGIAAGTAAVGGLGMMIPIMAGQYAMNQMGQGLQQRQAINRVLRQNFGGMMGIGGGRGGMGFSEEEMGAVSGMVREMGARDLFNNMEELTRVMDRTAQMGLYRGVQNARQFQQRFRETVTVLKEISQTMHTSIEEATNYMQTARGMGFFTGADITRNMLRTRYAAGATGMSVDQMVQIGQMGAQVGRAMGMRGRVGAQAAQNIATNIGMAQQMGVLTDETMADMTGGLTGAEATQALSGRVMEVNQRWLRSAAGRVTLAGAWDPNTGGIDRGVLARMQRGEISIGDLRTMGRRNIAATGGRASEFFAQEERLRGTMMEEGGALLMMGVIQEHLGRRRNLDFDDPLTQRFMRRRLGLSQDEVEGFSQWMRQLPRIQEQSAGRLRNQMEQDARSRALEQMGIGGFERKLSRAWEETVENPFKNVADSLLTQVSRGVRDMANAVEGRVRLQMTEEAKQAAVEMAMFGTTVSPATRGALASTASIQQAQMTAAPGGMGFLGSRAAAVGLGRLMGIRGPTSLELARSLGIETTAGGKTISSAEAESRIREFNMQAETINLGYSSGTMARMGQQARTALLKEWSLRPVGTEGVFGLSLAERNQQLDTAIQVARGSSAEAEQAFARAGNNRAQQIAIMNVLIKEAGLEKTTGGINIRTMTGGTPITSLEQFAAVTKAQREGGYDALTRAADPLGGGAGSWAVKAGSMIFGSAPVGLAATIITGRYNRESVRELMANDVVRENFQAVVSGDSSARTEALNRLTEMSQTSDNELTRGQRGVLRRLTKGLQSGNRETIEVINAGLKGVLEADARDSSVAVRTRERELANELRASLSSAEGQVRFSGREQALKDLRAIVGIRSSSNVDTTQANILEREFLAKYSNDAGLQEVLAQTPGAEYLSGGLGAVKRLEREMRAGGRAGRRPGESSELRLISSTMQEAMGMVGGLGAFGATREEQQQLLAAAKAGETTDALTILRKAAGRIKDTSQREALLESLERGKGTLGMAMGVAAGGVTEEERKTWATTLSMGGMAAQRLTGAQAEQTPEFRLQKDILTQLKKMTQYQEALVRSNDEANELLKQIQKQKPEGTTE